MQTEKRTEMKTLAILFVFTVLCTVSAQADCFEGFWSTLGCSLIGSTVSPTLSTIGVNEGKQGYIEQVRAEAAEYVADHGDSAPGSALPGSVLKEAIQKIRENTPEAREM